jgi:hypothetical protein
MDIFGLTYLNRKGRETENEPSLWYAKYCYIENEGHSYLKNPCRSICLNISKMVRFDEIGEMLSFYKERKKFNKREKETVIKCLEKMVSEQKYGLVKRLK